MSGSLQSVSIVVTGASSFAARPLLYALLRREPRQVVLYDPLDGLDELQAQLLPWCQQQGIAVVEPGNVRCPARHLRHPAADSR